VTAWYDLAFDDLYAEIYAHRNDEEAERAIRWLDGALAAAGLGRLRERRVLDLACGTGRYLRALAGAGAYGVGIDRSLALLARARRNLPPGAALVAGDVRALPFADGAFGGVVSMFTSLGYFASEPEHAAAFDNVGRVLEPGGFFLVDFLNATAVTQELRSSTRQAGDYEIEEVRALAAGGARIEKQVTIYRPSAGGGRELVKRYVESVALWDRAELEARLDRAGFETRTVAGDYAGAPFGPRSPRLLVLAARQKVSAG
jgi:SAM-dependent methyltransferase